MGSIQPLLLKVKEVTVEMASGSWERLRAPHYLSGLAKSPDQLDNYPEIPSGAFLVGLSRTKCLLLSVRCCLAQRGNPERNSHRGRGSIWISQEQLGVSAASQAQDRADSRPGSAGGL